MVCHSIRQNRPLLTGLLYRVWEGKDGATEWYVVSGLAVRGRGLTDALIEGLSDKEIEDKVTGLVKTGI